MNNTPRPYTTDRNARDVRDWRELPIVLVGLMGAGKSTVGRRLAKALDRPFTDVDEEIERAANRTIAEIFEDYGESQFRDGERRVIRRLMTGARGVIATGGGAFVDPETRELIRREAVSVWLDADIDTLVQRTGKRDTRPLLKGGDPYAILLGLKEQRGGAYAQADLHVVTDDGPHQTTVDRIIEALSRW